MEAELRRLAEELEALLGKEGRRVVAFYGEMGSGKTTTIGRLCRRWGVEGRVNSPTFSLINTYRIACTGEVVYHFDFYRIKDAEEAERLGVWEYFDSGALCLVEWPERVASLLPVDTVRVYIREEEDGSRRFKIG
ncbi:MAG: tRNA (adenosine(37)-N6)-threonylcarbamoyltransferase complex ATPase subunit type 1 TsaE [Tannerellaceae bacterium]|jgi:tRNA threonylcarbamoyladenosine biosynthesis protein TsaE|nr:tRNA (adenosine(37)-N6)-threonylcarbamoyltransferase complex ATPase subunit type 1 TsaE [Tannerellaceae bacterium]